MRAPLWQPDHRVVAQSNMHRFQAIAGARAGQPFDDYDSLHAWSIAKPEAFWSCVWDFAGIIGDKGPAPWLINASAMPGAEFFPSARLNFADNLLRRNTSDDALVFWGEDQLKMRWSWHDLGREAARFQGLLRQLGVTTDARIAAMVPNMPQTVAALLGATAEGCVWSSCSPDFGVKGVLDRFGQIEPEVLVTCDSYFYNGKVFSVADKLREISAALPSVRQVIVIDYAGGMETTLAATPKAVSWSDAVSSRSESWPDFKPQPFNHPLYILFSSGTTGMPKCIVHSVGGTLLKHATEQLLHSDVKPGDRVFYFTTCGWMMWNWLVTNLAAEATVLLYDGSPFAPDGNILFDYADAERMTLFGTSAKYIDALKKAGLRPRDTHDLATVRAVASTGSVLVPESFDYVYDAIKPDVHLASVSGGTDICGCFVLGNPVKAVWRGELQGAGLGLATDVFSSTGQSLSDGKGELVCRNPFPSMPIGFWNDPDGSRYRAAYFDRFPGVWHHGDFAEWTENGGMIIHGRSDATLNPGGVRIGTAEIYRQVEQLDEIIESIVIGQDWDGDVRVVLFVRLADGTTLDDELERRIKVQIREGASPRHVPSRIVAVADIPRTKSGKITELAVRDVVHGREIGNKEALANPEALDYFRDIALLRS